MTGVPGVVGDVEEYVPLKPVAVGASAIDPDPTPADIQLTGPPLVTTVRRTPIPLELSVAVTEVIDSVAHPAAAPPVAPLGPVVPLGPVGPLEPKGIHGSTTRA